MNRQHYTANEDVYADLKELQDGYSECSTCQSYEDSVNDRTAFDKRYDAVYAKHAQGTNYSVNGNPPPNLCFSYCGGGTSVLHGGKKSIENYAGAANDSCHCAPGSGPDEQGISCHVDTDCPQGDYCWAANNQDQCPSSAQGGNSQTASNSSICKCNINKNCPHPECNPIGCAQGGNPGSCDSFPCCEQVNQGGSGVNCLTCWGGSPDYTILDNESCDGDPCKNPA